MNTSPRAAEIKTLVTSLTRGDLKQAEQKSRHLTVRYRRHPLGWKVLGVVLDRLGRPEEALSAKLQAVALAPQDVEALHNLANAWLKQEHFPEAEVCYRKVVAMQPGFADAHRSLGTTLLYQRLPAQAETSYRHALRLNPRDAQAHDKLGNALRDQGRLDEAVVQFHLALESDARFAIAHNNLGTVLRDQGRADDAVEHFRMALALDPKLALVQNNLGAALQDQGLLDDALVEFRSALALDPALGIAHANLGTALVLQGQLDAARGHYRQAVALQPDNAEFHSNLLFFLLHDEGMAPAALAAAHIGFGERFEPMLRAHWQPHSNSRDPERRLRVGFVSGDLRKHAIAHFIKPVWAALDPAVLELWAYSNHAQQDAVTARLRRHAPNWRQVAGLSDAALAQQIRADGIDILIDLSGHTAHNRLLTFARKPAPVQASWIGYPGTTGLAAIDYLICDAFNAPHGLYERYYTEQFARLPSGAAFAPSELAPPVNPLPALRNGYLTFGSFNRPSKLGDAVIAAWSRVLVAVPRSRLLLGNVADAALAASLARRFAGHGIAPERLDFRATLPLARYLALHHEVDFLLDTWPYSGGTTTNHALWMGVPTVTLRGPSCAHCHSAAGLARLGLDDWIADDVDAFVRIATGWAGRPGELAQLRAGMRARWNGTPWRKHAVIARGLEMALRTMWRRWCAGLPVEHFEVPAAAVLEKARHG